MTDPKTMPIVYFASRAPLNRNLKSVLTCYRCGNSDRTHRWVNEKKKKNQNKFELISNFTKTRKARLLFSYVFVLHNNRRAYRGRSLE